jgi:hypothetical protein
MDFSHKDGPKWRKALLKEIRFAPFKAILR